MAIISFHTSSTGTAATISGSITPRTISLLNAYTKKKKLDIQSTTIKEHYGVEIQYLKHLKQ